MPSVKSILVPTDLSEAANRALDYAAPLANRFGAKVKLIHVIEHNPGATEPELYLLQSKRAIEKADDTLLSLARERIDEWIPVEARVATGQPWEKICSEARKSKSDLIILSTHGFKGLKRLFLGSTTERVIRHAPCSVLAVRGHGEADAERELQPKRILVPVDFSKRSRPALEFAVEVARPFNAEVIILYVVPVYYGVGEYDQAAYALLCADMRSTGTKKLAALIKAPFGRGVAMQTQIRHGRPGTEINDFAKDKNCDLIVISTHGWTGWNRVLLGSVTEEVVRYAQCPVLVFRNIKPN